MDLGPIAESHSPSGLARFSPLAAAMEAEVKNFGAAASGKTPRGSTPDDRSERRRPRLVANRAFGAIKTQRAATRTAIEVVAEWLNEAASSTPFLVLHVIAFAIAMALLVLHVVWFGAWMLWNIGYFGLAPFDPFPFGLLTMIVSLEAIFLSIFVLLAQKRESAIAELREEMSLQVGLRLEEEVTKTLQLVAGLYTRMGHNIAEDPELQETLQPLDLAAIEEELILQISTAAQMRRKSE